MPTDQTNQTIGSVDLHLGLKLITVSVQDDNTTYDLGGVDPWAAYSLLCAIANEIWDALPSPQREEA